MAPFIFGALGALIAPAFVTSKRLRNELQQETEMLDRLPAAAQTELRDDVQRRALLLVSLNRFPPLTRVDVVALTVVFFGLASGVFIIYALVTLEGDELSFGLPALIIPVYSFAAWALFHATWSKRSLLRMRYVFKHLGQAETYPIARMTQFGHFASTSFALFAIAILASTILGTWIYSNGWLGEEWLVPGGALLAVLLFVLLGKLVDDGDLVLEIKYVISKSGLEKDLGPEAFAKFDSGRTDAMTDL